MPLAIFQSVGVWEILLLMLVLLLVFGPKRLPEMGRSLGRGMREFKDSITGQDVEQEEAAAALTQQSSVQTASAAEAAAAQPATEAAPATEAQPAPAPAATTPSPPQPGTEQPSN